MSEQKETPLDALGEPAEIKMVEDTDRDLQLAMGAKQPASGIQIVAAANQEEASVEQAAEGSAREAQEDIAGRAAPEHEEGMTTEQTATEEINVRRGSPTVSACIGDAVAQSGP